MVSPLAIVLVRAELNDNDVTGLPEVSAEDDRSGAQAPMPPSAAGETLIQPVFGSLAFPAPHQFVPPVMVTLSPAFDVACRQVHRRGLRHGLASEEQLVGAVVERRVGPAAVVTRGGGGGAADHPGVDFRLRRRAQLLVGALGRVRRGGVGAERSVGTVPSGHPRARYDDLVGRAVSGFVRETAATEGDVGGAPAPSGRRRRVGLRRVGAEVEVDRPQVGGGVGVAGRSGWAAGSLPRQLGSCRGRRPRSRSRLVPPCTPLSVQIG